MIRVNNLLINTKYIVYIGYESSRKRVVFYLDLPNKYGSFYTIVLDDYNEEDYNFLCNNIYMAGLNED